MDHVSPQRVIIRLLQYQQVLVAIVLSTVMLRTFVNGFTRKYWPSIIISRWACIWKRNCSASLHCIPSIFNEVAKDGFWAHLSVNELLRLEEWGADRHALSGEFLALPFPINNIFKAMINDVQKKCFVWEESEWTLLLGSLLPFLFLLSLLLHYR